MYMLHVRILQPSRSLSEYILGNELIHLFLLSFRQIVYALFVISGDNRFIPIILNVIQCHLHVINILTSECTYQFGITHPIIFPVLLIGNLFYLG